MYRAVVTRATAAGIWFSVQSRWPGVEFGPCPHLANSVRMPGTVVGLADLIDPARMVLLPPQGYLEMLGLMGGASLVLTDSGGLQEETTALGVPCLTLRENTERPITVEQGTNTMVGRDLAAIRSGVADILAGRGKRGRVPELWDGLAAERIAADLFLWLKAGAA